MEETIIPMSGEQEIKKSRLVELFHKHILMPFNKVFHKSESTEKTIYADVIVRNEKGQVLLLERSYECGFEPGKWSFPGGHVDAGESALDGAKRELQEETGLEAEIKFVETVEKPDATVHYFEALLLASGNIYNANNPVIDNSILLDINEHRGYQWVDVDKITEEDLIMDLGTYIKDLLAKCFPITTAPVRKFSNALEAIAMDQGTGDLDSYWEILQKAFDENKITPEQFMVARQQYMNLKKAEAALLISKAFNEGLISEEKYFEAIQKGHIDPSHGGKLIQKQESVNGHITTKWVLKEEPESKKKVHSAVRTKVEGSQWWDHFKKYGLNAYPINVPESDVKVDESGDINSHWILAWKDPKTHAIKNAYTKEFLQRNADKKWERISHISKAKVDGIKEKTSLLIKNAKGDQQDAAAIINIIAHTGLRRGDKLKFNVTGNRGVSTLAPENVTINGSKIDFSFTGKSYQHNIASIEDAGLATYLSNLKKARGKERYLFETNDSVIDAVFDSVAGEDLKLKDLRTYVATDLAKTILFDDADIPPPLPKDLPEKKQKKIIKDKLTKCYELVSQRLNNTPAMARNSYIHPFVVSKWLQLLGVSTELAKSDNAEFPQFNISLDEIIHEHPAKKDIGAIEEDSEEMCDEFIDPTEGW